MFLIKNWIKSSIYFQICPSFRGVTKKCWDLFVIVSGKKSGCDKKLLLIRPIQGVVMLRVKIEIERALFVLSSGVV